MFQKGVNMKPGDMVTCVTGEELLHNELPNTGGYYFVSSRSGTLDSLSPGIVVAIDSNSSIRGHGIQIYVVSQNGAGWIDIGYVKKVTL